LILLFFLPHLNSLSLSSFPQDIIRGIGNNYWRLIRIGENSLSLEFSGVCAQVSSPLSNANIDEGQI